MGDPSKQLVRFFNQRHVVDFNMSDFQLGLTLYGIKDGFIKEGSTVSVMGVVKRHHNVLMIVPPSEPVSTGC